MRKLIGAAVVTGAAAILAVPAFGATRSVKVGDDFFVRASGVPTVTVKRGDVVRWRFSGSKAHNVVGKSGPQRFRSPVKTKGVYSKRFTRRGSYRIICEIHGAKNQSMRLVVR